MTTEQATLLSEFNFIVCVDASGSMAETDMPGGRSRWDYMQETLVAFTREILTIDEDGIDIVTFGGMNVNVVPNTNIEAVKRVFIERSPRGSTPLAEALIMAFHTAKKSSKKVVVIVFTDGVPDDKELAARTIIQQANSQDTDDQMTVLFIQVGNDAAATRYLQSLDDELHTAKFDIVDVKTLAQAEAYPTTVDLVFNAIKD